MTAMAPKNVDWNRFVETLSGVEVIRDRTQVEKLSKDYYYFSPILQSQLADKTADIVVRPKSEAEVLTVAKACVAERVPLTVRGAGTAIMGSAFP
jgi:FAD/FMN-containing dehydrogenase